VKPRSAFAVLSQNAPHARLFLVVYNPHRDGWVFPGGKVEDGETPAEGMVRELREETGVEALGWNPFYEGIADGVDRIVTAFSVFDFRVPDGCPRPETALLPPPRWMPLEMILKLTCFPVFYSRLSRRGPP
jgi:8-oxo-dGTP pyrophosphatase MutT (NUDIX family)